MSLSDETSENPFFVGIDNVVEWNLLSKQSNIYVLCRKSEAHDIAIIMQKNLKKAELSQLLSDTTYLETNKSILKITKHMETAKCVPDEYINPGSAVPGLHHLVVPLFELTEESAQEYIGMFKKRRSLDSCIRNIISLDYFAKDESVSNLLSNMVVNLKEVDYWTKQKNCDINLTSEFLDRGLKIRPARIEKPSLDKGTITDIFVKMMNNENRFNLFNILLLSKKESSLVVNNQVILKIMEPIIRKNLGFYKYLWGYVWAKLYLERLRTKSGDNFVFDINTANCLPMFPYYQQDIHANPYCTIFVNSNILNSRMNSLGLSMMKNYIEYGVCDLDTFRERFVIFTSDDEGDPIFDDLKRDEKGRYDGIVFVGDCVSACAHKRHPCIDILSGGSNDPDEQLRKLYIEYYSSTNTEMVSYCKSIFKYLDKIEEIVKIIGEHKGDGVEVEISKKATYFVNTEYLKFINGYNQGETSDEILRELLDEEYIIRKNRANREHRKMYPGNKFYENFYAKVNDDNIKIVKNIDNLYEKDTNFDDANIYIMMNDFLKNRVPPSENLLLVKIEEGIDFKISHKALPRQIIIKRIVDQSPLDYIANLCLPNQRAYYDGNTVYMLPEFITAMHTFINIDHRCGILDKKSIEMINENKMRGFGTLLNAHEKQLVSDHITADEKLRQIFEKKYFDSIKLTDKTVKPGLVFENLTDDAYYMKVEKYVMTFSNLCSYYEKVSGHSNSDDDLDILKFKTINKKGSINPFKKWVLNLEPIL